MTRTLIPWSPKKSIRLGWVRRVANRTRAEPAEPVPRDDVIQPVPYRARHEPAGRHQAPRKTEKLKNTDRRLRFEPGASIREQNVSFVARGLQIVVPIKRCSDRRLRWHHTE